MTDSPFVIWFEQIRMSDVATVGGKNASLGELISQLASAGVRVPRGFATTAEAYQVFLRDNGLDSAIEKLLAPLDPDDLPALSSCGSQIRNLILHAEFPVKLREALTRSYLELTAEPGGTPTVAVRSSATAEDLPDASFAGQQETFLNIVGEENVLQAAKQVFASLFTDRAISYRAHHGYRHSDVSLSVGIQQMIRSDQAASGVLFTIDTESGFDRVVFITSSYGLGEGVVQGAVNPDEFYVSKPALEAGRPAILRRRLGSKRTKMIFGESARAGVSVQTVDVPETAQRQFSLSDAEVEALARYAVSIEQHYQRPMDIEWGKDGANGELYILQARPETVQSRSTKESQVRYTLKSRSQILVTGRAIGQKVGCGVVRNVPHARDIHRVKAGDILVTDMTDPDWEPVMKIASAIVTNRGGRTCHAAIIARELGIPAIVGCGDATERLKDGTAVTVSCAEGDTGNVYAGELEVEKTVLNAESLPPLPVKLTMNIANPDLAFEFQRLPNAGIGLARLEFIIARTIGLHPRACLDYPNIPAKIRELIDHHIAGYPSPVDFYVEKLTEGVACLAAAFSPKPVIVRLSDFKSNEYSGLIGGDLYEPHEENPMIGFRGASRYIADSFRSSFDLECRAMKRVRNEMGFTNLELMIPFVRTLDEARGVLAALDRNGLRRGENGLRVIMMCEIPSNALLAEQFLELFDGFSIGSNDLTQLTLGLDRDSGIVAGAFDERDPAVKALLRLAIQACRKKRKYIGICGQGPSDFPDLAQWLVDEGIESLSLNPDTVIDTWLMLAQSGS